LTGLSTLSLIAGLFIIYNTTSTGAVRRAAVMGELRLLGAKGSLLFRLLVIEAVILGALGSLLGMFGGIGLAHLLTGMVAESMGVIFQLRFPIERLTIDPAEQAGFLALGLGAAVFASYFAARRASRVEPLAMFRGELSAPPAPTSTGRLVASWTFLIILVSIALAIQVWRKSYVWGNLASALWYASYVVIAVPVVTWLAKPLHRILSRLFGMEGRFAVESLLRARTRTGITVAAVALMLALAITASTVATSFRKSVAAYFEEGFFAGDLIVSAASTEGGWLETPLPNRIVDELGALPGVRQLDSMRALFGQIYRGERIAIIALSDGFLTPERFGARWYVEGDAARASAQLRAGEGLDVSENLAERFGLHVGDPLELETPTGTLTLPIAGVIRDYVSDRGTVAMSRRLFIDRWKETSVNRVHVFLDPAVSGDEMRRRIVAQLGSQHRLRVLSLQELMQYQAGAVDRAFAFTHAIQLLILTVTVAGLVDLLVAGIVERRRELSLWQVIGADRRSVGRSIIVESATVGALGALLGAAIGLFTAWIWLRFNFRYLLGFSLDYHLPVAATAWYFVLVMAVTISVGYWAARYATSQSVLDGLRTESAPNLR
jgi:putative ABC transport system permease protein